MCPTHLSVNNLGIIARHYIGIRILVQFIDVYIRI